MSKTIQDYLAFITSEFVGQPNYTAMISADVSPSVQVQSLLDSMIPIFDIDLNPVGNQLDIIGLWVGVSRNVTVPLTGIYFSWDDTASDGWDFGTWSPTGNPTGITSLPDDAYLTLIRARIGANHWDGTTEGAYAIWSVAFPGETLLIQDYQNMSFSVAIVGMVPNSITLALLIGGYLPLRPEGVQIISYFVPVNNGPLFGWDIENAYVQGWDQGSWAREIFPT